MPGFNYAERARAVNEANAELDAAVKESFELNGGRRNPISQRWERALTAFFAALKVAYPEPLRQVSMGLQPVSELATHEILEFLEADPMFIRSGYLKERLLRELARRQLDQDETARLRAVIVANAVRKPFRREFKRYCRAALAVDAPPFRDKLQALAEGPDANVAIRATKVLAALVTENGNPS